MDKHQEQIAELDKIAKLLIRRDFELAQFKQKQQEQINEFKRITQMLIKRDLALNQTKLLLQGALIKSDQLRLELEIEKNKIEAIINSLDCGILVVDGQMRFIFINPRAEEYCKVRFEEISHKPMKNFFLHSGLGPVLKLIGSEPEGKYVKKELVLGGTDERVFQVSAIPLTDRPRNILGSIIVLYDISREKLIERMKTEFVSITAHQLRTPLSGIKWVFLMLLEGDAGPITEEQQILVQKGYESNERMISLVNDLLNLARLEEGKFLYKFSSISLVDLIKDNINLLLPIAKKRKVDLILKKPKGDMPKVEADSEKIQLVIQNLIDNALRYTFEGGKVTISIKFDKLYAEVAVKDTGIGIPLKNQLRIFDKFFRADNALKMETDGSGLGLFISKNIIDKHNGKIWFESKENKGSTFYFRIPINNKITS